MQKQHGIGRCRCRSLSVQYMPEAGNAATERGSAISGAFPPGEAQSDKRYRRPSSGSLLQAGSAPENPSRHWKLNSGCGGSLPEEARIFILINETSM